MIKYTMCQKNGSTLQFSQLYTLRMISATLLFDNQQCNFPYWITKCKIAEITQTNKQPMGYDTQLTFGGSYLGNSVGG